MRGLGLVVMAAAGAYVAHRRVFGIQQRSCWPPPADAVTSAWSTAATLEPWAAGTSFFPRIFADVDAARSGAHPHVDNMGSKPRGAAREMYDGLARAGAQILVHDFRDNPGRVDHRKLYVIDGACAWRTTSPVTRAITSWKRPSSKWSSMPAPPVQAIRGHGGPLPADLSELFPAPPDPGTVPVARAQVTPTGASGP